MTTGDREPSLMWDGIFAIVLGFFLLMSLRSGLKVGAIERGPAAVFLGVYLQCWGLLFLASYFFPNRSYLLKGLMWLCENTSTPRGRWTAILWGAFAIIMSTIPVLQGLGLLAI